jgi:4-hydroxy-tetrahydrodipicolinate reductase
MKVQNVAMLGASGRMGRNIIPLLAQASDLRLSGALAIDGDPAIGQDAGVMSGTAPLGVVVTSDVDRALSGAAVAIDFTLPAPSLEHARRCHAARIPLVIGTTGHDADGRAALESYARSIPIVLAPNMSLGVNLLLKLAELAGRSLGPGYDVEIVEAHHRQKIDAPSGTALALGRAVARGRGAPLEELAVHARHGAVGPRPEGAIGFAVIRGGDIAGDHRLLFAGPGERVELAHHAEDRSAFARGALAAARWVIGRPPALYSMQDVLGF